MIAILENAFLPPGCESDSAQPAQSVDKPRWPWEQAWPIARELLLTLEPACSRAVVAGSIRRRKPMVGDIEILYIPRIERRKSESDMFSMVDLNLADSVLTYLLAVQAIEKRKNVNGSETWGQSNKLARHKASGIPIDFFSATEGNWWNYLVCRTGPKESNVRIATAAQRAGWRWSPYASGFTRQVGLGSETHQVNSEREVFEFVGLHYFEPWERE